MKVSLVSLGCARTLVDSEVALGSLKKEGYEIVQDVSHADVAIVNTCGFIEEAKIESIEIILRLCELKKKGRLKAVVVLGCLAQRHGAELKAELGDEVDAIIGTDSYADLAKLLAPLRENNKKIFKVKAKPHFLLDENTPRVSLTPAHFVYIKISEGCMNACTYCVIPQMKGRHRSRTIESILNELRNISSERKISEINLIGQDTAAFGFDRGRGFELPELLRKIAQLNAAPWIRLLYAHPGHVTQELIDVMAEYPSICKYLDFPIEHSHDNILKRMNRAVSRARMEWGIENFRKKIPSINIRTTVIVGFPGETKEEFQDLMKFLKQVRFERLGAFIFSEEEGARAYGLPNPISDELKKERFNAVMAQQQEISREINDSFVGKTLKVLIDEKGPKEDSVYFGRTEGDAPLVDGQVIVHSKTVLKAGDFVRVKINDALEYDLIGENDSTTSFDV